MNIDWDILLTPLWVVARVLLVYALPWGFAFEASNLLVHSQGSWDVSSPGEGALERGGDILLYGLSLIMGGIFWAFSPVLAVAAVHQGMLLWLSRRLSWNKASRLAGHLTFGILTGMVLFYFLRLPGHLLWAGFDYYAPPLAVPVLISCVVASGCAGTYSLRGGVYTP